MTALAAIFYVYVYFRLDGTPCYVGKGKGERWRHRGKWGRNLHFVRLRDQAKALGKELPHVKIAEGLTEDEALRIEAIFIAAPSWAMMNSVRYTMPDLAA